MSAPKKKDEREDPAGYSVPQEILDELVGLPCDEFFVRLREHERAVRKPEGETN
jgi:hypothetical protein